jgi:hypothetical protein
MDSLNELILIAQSILDNGFTVQDFQMWQQLAFVTILSLLGPFHFYTRNFCDFTAKPSRQSLLTGEGILEAARALIADGPYSRHPDGRIEHVPLPVQYTPWTSRPKKWHSLQDLMSRLR